MKKKLSGLLIFLGITSSLVAPAGASAQTWQCQIQIPKSGNISSWCGMSPINFRVSGSRGTGWIGMEPFNLSLSANRVSGWIGTNAVSLSKRGSFVSGWVGQTPVNCRVTGRNNFCLTVTTSDPS